jgi:hypothetical protein
MNQQMKQPPEDDHRLVAFMRQHKPPVPSNPSPQLEQQLMAAVDAARCSGSTRQTASRLTLNIGFGQRWVWLPIGAIATVATVMMAIWANPPAWQSVVHSPRDAELAELESFIESSWYDSTSDSPPNSTIANPTSQDVFWLVDDSTAN